jgi:opacity protein-like surface antigen
LTASLRHSQETFAERGAVAKEELPVRLNPQKVAAVAKKIPNHKFEMMPRRELLIADASAEMKRRRWGFGMGGGSYGVNSSSSDVASTAGMMIRSAHEEYLFHRPDAMRLRSESEVALSDGNEIYARAYEAPTGRVEHKTPLSAGLGVSYYLNDRWSLQSGLTYTLLRSEWGFDNVAGSSLAENKQYLHFVGIPLSLTYRIAEWKRFQLYASAGGMYERNVAGRYNYTETASFPEDLKIIKSESLRMKEPLWSANIRAGVTYPLWRFINVYAEAGASYYFDNKSAIKTIRSDKPFNVSLQAGVRLGF